MTAPAAAPPVAPPPAGDQVALQTVALDLVVSGLGLRRRVDPARLKLRNAEGDEVAGEIDADADLVHVGKDILESVELKPIRKLDGAIKRRILGLAVPSRVLRAGMHLVPLALLEDVDRELRAYEAARAAAVEAFCGRYPGLVQAMQTKLKGNYDPLDYPAVETVRAAFRVDAQYLSFNVPAALERVNAEIFARERSRVARKWDEAATQIRDALRAGFADLVGRMADRLGTEEEGKRVGKRKVFRDTLVENMTQFLAVFEARNLTDDGELSVLVGRARQLLAGVSPERLRAEDSTRDAIRAGFAQIGQQLGGMVVTRSRAVSFEDER